MKLENGNLVLSADEITVLSIATMQQIDPVYPIEEFIGSMASIIEEAKQYIRETRSKPDFSNRDELKIGVTQAVVEVCEMLSERAYGIVEDAGYEIKWQ